MKKRKFEDTCRREFARFDAGHRGAKIVAGGFGGFGGVPRGLLEAMAGDRFDVYQLGPDQFELVAKESGEAERPAA